MTDTTIAVDPVDRWIASLSDPEAVALDLIAAETTKDTDNLAAVCVQLHEQLQRWTEHHAALQSNQTAPIFSDLYAREVDAETVWGQVSQMNLKLRKIVNKTMPGLGQATELQLLAIEDEEEEEQSDEERQAVSDDAESETSMSGEDDDERRRIQARMNKVMEDMEDDEEDDVSDEDDRSSSPHQKETASLVDPKEFETDRDAVNLHDGFFNLQEMEAFADEEEGYLPDEAYGEEVPEQNDAPSDTRSFHQKQRDGDMEIEDNVDVESDEENPLTFRTKQDSRRRNYREDEDVDALYQLYEDNASSKQIVDDRDDDDDAIHMTAADLFGKPNQKYYKRWNSKEGDFKDDSWSLYDDDRASSNQKSKSKWTDVGADEDMAEDGESEDEEEVPMKEAEQTKASQKAYNKQSAKIIAQTEQLEKELLAEKPWQMTGETVSTARPVNSLLQTTPEFEVASKVAPEINMAFTENLEEAIKKRILEENWDDVVPRELPDVGWHSKRGEAPEVSQEKSKLSLGELYEREYLKKTAGYDVEAAEKETEEQKAKNEMKSLFANLCSKLDALSNYHFTPRPLAVEPEARVITQPAIAMEEVLPLHFNSERASAPEEVFGAKRGRDGILRAESEMDQTDRKRLRRAKKAARRKARKSKLADEKLVSRLQPGNGLDNPYEKRRMQEELSMARSSGKVTTGDVDSNKYGDSTTFFKRMQQEAQATIASGSKNADSEEGKGRRGASSSFKL